MLSTKPTTTDSTQDHVTTLAAELTRKAYALALQYKNTGSWLDLELDLWRAVTESLGRTQATGSNAA
jgi:hypothetical protein